MIKIVHDDIWDWRIKNWSIIVPTNGYVNSTGDNVMGAGVALQARQLFGGIQYVIGEKLKKYGNHVFYFPRQKLFSFPTKDNWKDNSTLELIEQSCKELQLMWPLIEQDNLEKVKETRKKKNDTTPINDDEWQVKIAMCKIGCGWGGLTWDVVEPIVEKYFGNVSSDKFVIVDNESGFTREYRGKNLEGKKGDDVTDYVPYIE